MKYTEPRYTKDIDIWVEPTLVNARRVYNALMQFGAPLDNVEARDFARQGTLFLMGIPPNRFDILTRVRPLQFNKAWLKRNTSELDGVRVHFLAKDDLMCTKKKAGRPQDLIDLENLKKTPTKVETLRKNMLGM